MSSVATETDVLNISQSVSGINNRYDVIRIDQIKENEWNPNEMDAIQFATLKKSIKDSKGNHAFPVLVRTKKETGQYEIIDGAHRYRAMKELGYSMIVVNICDLEDSEARLKTLAMNKLRGEFEEQKLANLLVELENTYNISDRDIYNFTAITPEETKILKDSLFLDYTKDADIADLTDELLKNNTRLFFEIPQEDYEFLKKVCALFKDKKFEKNFLYLCYFYVNDEGI